MLLKSALLLIAFLLFIPSHIALWMAHSHAADAKRNGGLMTPEQFRLFTAWRAMMVAISVVQVFLFLIWSFL